MIATERFVFLHLHKSGGSFVNECLMRHVPGAKHIGYHLPRSLIPAPLAHLPVLGLVRNPWSYYVSWFAFQSSRPQPNPLYRILSDEGRLDFEATVRNMIHLGEDATRLERLIDALPAAYTHHGLNLPGFALRPIRGAGVGFYTFLYRYLYGEGPILLGRMEELRTELLALLGQVGQPVSEAMREHVLREAPVNASRHGPYATYYSAALAREVAERDAEVIARHGYRFAA
jgi:hypothetical protein